MPNVWKIGSRWGNNGPSVLDLFMEYGCVFFGGKDDSGVGDWGSVKKGDLFIVSDGSTAVAIGEALDDEFKSYKESGIRFRKRDADEVIDDTVVFCPARLILLEKAERDEYWGIDPRKRFCRASGAADKVREYWEKKGHTQRSESFDIATRVVSLSDESDPGRLFQSSIKYSIPIYQRPYSWGDGELRRLMDDLHQGLLVNDPVFVGTIQLSEPIPLKPDGSICSYNVIDGQQRLTTFIILLSIIEKMLGEDATTLEFAKSNFKTSVNKRSAQDDLDAFFAFFGKQALTDEPPSSQQNNPYIANAKILYGLLQEFAARPSEEQAEDDEADASGEKLTEYAEQMRNFISKHIKIVVIETHAGLSKTLKIFNTINSSGLDLGSEDLFKVRYYEYLRASGESESVFDRITELYERIDEYNRQPFVGAWLSMSQILSTCQRYLIAKHDLNAALFSVSSESFFEDLFDTALNIRLSPEFKCLANVANNDGADPFAVEELAYIVKCHIDYLEACSKDPDLRIARSMIWETRYGYAADFPVLAMVTGVATPQTIKAFVWRLFKALVPASLYFAKHVYRGRAYLIELLKDMWKVGHGGGEVLNEVWASKEWTFNGLSPEQMFDAAIGYSIAWTPKWKNLLCRLAEYVMSPHKDEALFTRLFKTGFDIEHIQSWTDEDTPDETRDEWGEEINKIGNLAMFESSLNRSVHNHPGLKAVEYGKSAYATIRKVQAKVGNWTKGDAIARRENLSSKIKAFIFSD